MMTQILKIKTETVLNFVLNNNSILGEESKKKKNEKMKKLP